MQYGHSEPYGAPGTGYSADTMAVWLANEVATQTIRKMNASHQPKYTPETLERLFASCPMEAAVDELCHSIDYDLHRVVPGWHVSWWTPDKMRRELLAAGFSDVVISVAGGSVAPVMRDRAYFDIVSPTFSLFVEGIV